MVEKYTQFGTVAAVQDVQGVGCPFITNRIWWMCEANTVPRRLAQASAGVPRRRAAGRRLTAGKIQRGDQPDDFKPMPALGKGVEELRIWDESGTYRVLYTARLKD